MHGRASLWGNARLQTNHHGQDYPFPLHIPCRTCLAPALPCCVSLHRAAPLVQVTVNIRPCLINEFMAVTRDACLPCSPGLFNMDITATQCTSCPSNAVCNDAQARGLIVPVNGFWHSNFFSEQVCAHKRACMSVCMRARGCKVTGQCSREGPALPQGRCGGSYSEPEDGAWCGGGCSNHLSGTTGQDETEGE